MCVPHHITSHHTAPACAAGHDPGSRMDTISAEINDPARSPKSGGSGSGAGQVVVPPALGLTTCHSAQSADVCFHSSLDRLEGKLDIFQFCPSLISSHWVENNSSYLCCCTSTWAVFY